MSYILDALRRAESERERGSVPRLHSQPLAGAEAAEAGLLAPAGRGLRGPALLGAGLLLAAAVGFLVLKGQESQPSPAPAGTVAAAPPPLPLVQPPPPSPVALVRVDPPPLASAAVPAAPVASVAASAASVATAAVAERPLPLASELPQPLRGELPALQAGGAMVADQPSGSMLIINGQLYREGDHITPQLRLEQIRLRGAVLVYKGQRFRISY
ncbi:general secretion pathway protein GspB [Roseateles violae]|uniref:General secretion pathway protein GspB n=1 Tax=Roseateles violae TaxID=3058042 RepID=A0ABT8DTA9_9BURK|nr:general secretion pathway protein GspB [Pelomonas sp. PFR6]MDN3921427.1 general secretion pathway protein GspB [Pelomonas sp. PFR6]